MKKCLCLLLALTMLLCACTALADSSAHIAALKGPTAMGMVQMMRDKSDSYEFTLAASADEVTPKLIKGEIDIAAVPANLASVLYNNTEGSVRVLAVNTLGVLYIVERGESVQSAEDLRGKTIYTAGKGSTPEYALNYILSSNGIDPASDVTIEFKSEHAECLTALLNDSSAVAMLPQPFVTVAQAKAPDMRIALDLTKEWDALQEGAENPSAMITGVVIARTDFIEQNPDIVSAFMTDYAESVRFTQEKVAESASLIGEYNIFEAAVAEKALPYCNITFIAGEEMHTMLDGYLSELHRQNPASVGGKLPEEDFYYAG